MEICQKIKENNYTGKGILRERQRFGIFLAEKSQGIEKHFKYIWMKSCNEKCGRICWNIIKERQKNFLFWILWGNIGKQLRHLYLVLQRTLERKKGVIANSFRN